MRLRTETAAALAAICGGLAFALYPHAKLAGSLLLARDDPAAIADIHLDVARAQDPQLFVRSIEDALATNDGELAVALTALARDRPAPLPDDLIQRVDELAAQQGSASALASQFASGVLTGQADDFASLSGAIAGDMFAFGDIRDVVVEGRKFATGEEPDHLVLGLAAAGVAFTAATVATAGAAVPVRVGITIAKDARKAGRLSAGLASWFGRQARELIDAPALQSAVANASMARPGPTVAAIKAAFRTDRAGALVRAATDIGQIGRRAGTKGAVDALRVAESPADLPRIVKLAEKKGGQTRAYLRLLGRSALVLLVGVGQLSLWVLGLVIATLSFLITVKSASERGSRSAALRWRRWRARRAARAEATKAAKAAKAQAHEAEADDDSAAADPAPPSMADARSA
jgi:hypothetical protein